MLQSSPATLEGYAFLPHYVDEGGVGGFVIVPHLKA